MSPENTETIQEKTPEPEPPEPASSSSSSQTEPKPPEPVPSEPKEEEPAPKRRGRPEGAKDRAPRKKKVVVVEEDIQAPQNTPEPEAPVQTPAPPVQTPEPDSPRTLIRNAADHILKLKSVTRMARRTHLQDEYTKRLHSLS